MKALIFCLFISTSLIASQAVIFDFGGVMRGKSHPAILEETLRSTLHLTEEELIKAQAQAKAMASKGVGPLQYWSGFAEKKAMALPPRWPQKLQGALLCSINIRPEMFALVDALKAEQIQVGLLSNMRFAHAQLYRELGLLAPFQPCLLSYEIGVEKPAPEAYKILLDCLQMAAADVIFIDDKLENVIAAEKLGIDAIQFISVEQIKQELTARLGQKCGEGL